MGLRVSGILDVQQLMGGLSTCMHTIGISPDMQAERLQSAGVRFDTEDHLFEQMWRSPVFGVGSWYFNQYVDPQTGEVDTVTIDGFWTLQLATRGLLGLCSWLALSLLPVLVFLRRYPLGAWRSPIVSTAGALAVILVMHTIDCIPNPNVDPIFTLIASGLIGLPALGGLRAARAARRTQDQRLLENKPPMRGVRWTKRTMMSARRACPRAFGWWSSASHQSELMSRS
jgi:hypothetical protein